MAESTHEPHAERPGAHLSRCQALQPQSEASGVAGGQSSLWLKRTVYGESLTVSVSGASMRSTNRSTGRLTPSLLRSSSTQLHQLLRPVQDGATTEHRPESSRGVGEVIRSCAVFGHAFEVPLQRAAGAAPRTGAPERFVSRASQARGACAQCAGSLSGGEANRRKTEGTGEKSTSTVIVRRSLLEHQTNGCP